MKVATGNGVGHIVHAPRHAMRRHLPREGISKSRMGRTWRLSDRLGLRLAHIAGIGTWVRPATEPKTKSSEDSR